MKGLTQLRSAAFWRRLTPVVEPERWRRAFTHDLGLKLLSLAIAFSLWIFVNASERDTELALQVPLELRSIPAHLMVTSPRVDFIDIRVSGPRTLLGRIDRKRLLIPLDLSGIHPGPAVFRITGDTLNLPRGVKIVRITPAQVTLDLERVIRRTVAVHLQLVGKLPAGLSIVDERVSPESVEVIGPASAVEDVKAVETEPLDVGGATPGILERELALPEISDYVSFSAQRVAAQVHIGEVEIERDFKRVQVSVRNTSLRATIRPEEIRLTLRGPQRTMESLELNHGEVYIDAAGLAPGRYERVPTVDLPPGVEVVRQEPPKVGLRLQKGRR